MLHKNIPYRRKAQRKSKARLRFLAERLSYWPSGAYKVEKDGKSWYRRYYRGSASKYLKKQTAKKNRRNNKKYSDEDSICDGRSLYHRVYDFWWELY